MAEPLKTRINNEVFKNLNKNKDFSLRVAALYKGKEVFNELYGKKYKYYDLASLTKAIFPATYFYARPDLLELKISDVLPWLYMSNIKVKDLLNHSSGLPGYKEFYKVLRSLPKDEVKSELQRLLRSEVLKIKKGPKKVVYSDLGFLILGLLMESLEGENLDRIFDLENKAEGFHFCVDKPKYKKTLYAPTEKCSWREKTIQGEVFDDNTTVLGGVGAHAGLFGTVGDVLSYGKILRKMYFSKPEYFKKSNKEFANGFMIPSGPGTTAGKMFSKKSIGHLGFTGTSFWYDPEKDLFIVILSNRTHPDRNDGNFNRFRPIIQDLIYKEFI